MKKKKAYRLWIQKPFGEWQFLENFNSSIEREPGTFWIENAGIGVTLPDGKRIFASTFYIENWP